MTAETDSLRLMPEHATDAALSLAPVLRSRGRKNSLHDIKRAANLLELLALDVSRHDAAPAVQPAAGKPMAWARRWFVDGITPKKERNENGRMAWPKKFTYHEVTRSKVMTDDVALYAHPPAQASESGGERLGLITQALVRADEEFGSSLSAYRYRRLAEAVAAFSASQAAPGEGEQS